MRISAACVPLLRSLFCSSAVRTFSVTATRRNVDDFSEGWNEAKPFTDIPGPTTFQFIRWFLPGGSLYNASGIQVQQHLNTLYGPLARVPGLFGKPNVVYVFDPEHNKTIFRTEGAWPLRRNIETFDYYRKRLRPDVFLDMGGLVSDQGEQWHKLRKIANPVMLSPRTVRSYMPAVDQVSQEFVRMVRDMRDENDEMPADFGNWISLWALETVGLMALDRRVGVMSTERDADADQFILAVDDFFRLAFELEHRPSFWRYYHTREFRKLIAAFDVMTKYVSKYIDQAIIDLERNKQSDDRDLEISVLQKLLEKDRHYAFLMTFDMIFAGTDTTSAAMSILLYNLAINPEKQDKLRSEIVRLLPNKDTEITKDNYGEFAYFRACLKESMRLQPQVPHNLRGAGQNIVLGGYQIPYDTDLLMANNTLQTSEKYFANSDQFLPERWLRDDCVFEAELKSRHPFVYLPFGFGPRSCIGKRFAEMEIQILAARLLREYRVEWHHGPMQYVTALVVKPSSKLKFKMVPI